SEAQRRLDEARLRIDKTRTEQEATRCDLEVDLAKAEADFKVAGLPGKLAKDLLAAYTYQKNQLDFDKAKLAVEKAKSQLDNHVPGMPVLSLPDLQSMQVVGFVYDTELRYLSPGMVTDLGLDAVPGKSWRGKILSLTSVAGRKGFASQHKVFRAVIQPDALDLGVMKPGMTVRVEVAVSLASRVVAIPREYVGLDEAGRYFVRK